MHPANPIPPALAAFLAWNAHADALNARPDPRTAEDATEEARQAYEAALEDQDYTSN